MNTDIINLATSVVMKLIDWGRDMFKGEREKRELEIFKRLAQADILGITEGELKDQSGVASGAVRTALKDLGRAGRAFYRNGRWYGRDPVVEVARFAPRS